MKFDATTFIINQTVLTSTAVYIGQFSMRYEMTLKIKWVIIHNQSIEEMVCIYVPFFNYQVNSFNEFLPIFPCSIYIL
jgi:hypothetical protein